VRVWRGGLGLHALSQNFYKVVNFIYIYIYKIPCVIIVLEDNRPSECREIAHILWKPKFITIQIPPLVPTLIQISGLYAPIPLFTGPFSITRVFLCTSSKVVSFLQPLVTSSFLHSAILIRHVYKTSDIIVVLYIPYLSL
jgi:hypothetical protein